MKIDFNCHHIWAFIKKLEGMSQTKFDDCFNFKLELLLLNLQIMILHEPKSVCREEKKHWKLHIRSSLRFKCSKEQRKIKFSVDGFHISHSNWNVFLFCYNIDGLCNDALRDGAAKASPANDLSTHSKSQILSLSADKWKTFIWILSQSSFYPLKFLLPPSSVKYDVDPFFMSLPQVLYVALSAHRLHESEEAYLSPRIFFTLSVFVVGGARASRLMRTFF